uniref:Uncharacterized protein n=1 Tax=Odontella aurita TaxID=265563 RepID=A0A7S4J6K9_9STRA|mmetsp:Transcript_39939/g.120304  ORF Transcript_39939/g.120304 Transcript_39939/m.120304 type:complete len:2448 (+) Transcript_39939:427-7770(+)
MTVHDNVDVCVTCISDKPPTLPLREELPSLGVELVYNSRGAGMRAVRRESRRKMRRMSAQLERKMERENRKSAALLGMRGARGSAKQDRLEEQLEALRTLEEEGTDDDITREGKGNDDYGVTKKSPSKQGKDGDFDTRKARLALPAIVKMKMAAKKMRKAVSYESYKKAAEKAAAAGTGGTDSSDDATHATVDQSSSSSSSSGIEVNSSSSNSSDLSSSSIEESSSSDQDLKPSMSARSFRGLPALASPMSAQSAPATITVAGGSHEGTADSNGGAGNGMVGGPDDAAGRSHPSSSILGLPPASPIGQLLQQRREEQRREQQLQRQQTDGLNAAGGSRRASSLPPWAKSTWTEATSPQSNPKSQQQGESVGSPRPSPFSFLNFDVVGGEDDRGQDQQGQGQETQGGHRTTSLSPGGGSGRWWYESVGNATDADTVDGPVPMPLQKQSRLDSITTDLECTTGNYSTCTDGTYNATARPHPPSNMMGMGMGTALSLSTQTTEGTFTDGSISGSYAADRMMLLPYNDIISGERIASGGIQSTDAKAAQDGDYTLKECTFEVVEEWNNAFRAMCAMSTMLGNTPTEDSSSRAIQSFSEDEDMRRLIKRQEKRMALQRQAQASEALRAQHGQPLGQEGALAQVSPELQQGQQLDSAHGVSGQHLDVPRRGPRSPTNEGQGFENELFAALSRPDITADDVKAIVDMHPAFVCAEVAVTGRSPLHATCDRPFPVRCVGQPMFPDVPPPTSPATSSVAGAAASPSAISLAERETEEPRSPLAAVVASLRGSASGLSPRAFFGEGVDTPNSSNRGNVSLLHSPVASNVPHPRHQNRDGGMLDGNSEGSSSPIFSPVSLSTPHSHVTARSNAWPQTPNAPQTPLTPVLNRSRQETSDDIDSYLDALIADAVNARVLLKLVAWSHVDAVCMPDRAGDLPVHLLARRLAEWEDEWTAALSVYIGSSPGRRGSGGRNIEGVENDLVDEARVSSLQRIVAQCVEVVLHPVASQRALCRARGSVGIMLPLHIGAALGCSYDTLRVLCEEYGEGAGEKCTAVLPAIGTGTTSVPIYGKDGGMIALELLERNSPPGISPAAVAEAENEASNHNKDAPHLSSSKGATTTSVAGVKWTDSVLYGGGHVGSHDDFLHKSDLLFAFHPELLPQRHDPARLRRLEQLIRNEAKTRNKMMQDVSRSKEDAKMKLPDIGCGAGPAGPSSSQAQDKKSTSSSTLSPAAKSAWIFLTCHRADGTNPDDYRGKDLGRGTYVDNVKTTVEGLDSVALEELTSVKVGGERELLNGEDGGRDLLEAAAPACADAIKDAVEKTAAKREEEERKELEQEHAQQSSVLKMTPSMPIVESAGRRNTTTQGMTCLALGAMVAMPPTTLASTQAQPYHDACATPVSSNAGQDSTSSFPKIAGAGGTTLPIARGNPPEVESSFPPSVKTKSTVVGLPSASTTQVQQLHTTGTRSILKKKGRVAVSARASSESLGRLCRSVFQVHQGSDAPAAFIVLPYRLKVAPEEEALQGAAGNVTAVVAPQRPTLERPEDAELAVKFAEALLKITEAPAIIYTLEEKFKRTTGRLGGAEVNESLSPSQRDEVERTFEDFLSLFRFTGYLYLLDESNGMPRVPPPSSSCMSPTSSVCSPTNSVASSSTCSSSTARRRQRQPYPIMVTNASKNVRMLLPLMQMGMILMRGNQAIKVLAETVVGGPGWLRSPSWVGVAREMAACTYSREAPAPTGAKGGGDGELSLQTGTKGNGNLPLDGDLRDRLFEYSALMSPRTEDDGAIAGQEEDLQGAEWAVEVSLVKILLEKFDPKRTHAGLVSVRGEEGANHGDSKRVDESTIWVYQPEGQGEDATGMPAAATLVVAAPTYRDIRADVERELDSILQKSSMVAFDRRAANQDQQEASEMSASDVSSRASRDSGSVGAMPVPPTAMTTPNSSLKGEILEQAAAEDDKDDEDAVVAATSKKPAMVVPDVVHTLSRVDESTEEKAHLDNDDAHSSSSTLDYSAGNRRKYSGQGGDSLAYSASRYSGSRKSHSNSERGEEDISSSYKACDKNELSAIGIGNAGIGANGNDLGENGKSPPSTVSRQQPYLRASIDLELLEPDDDDIAAAEAEMKELQLRIMSSIEEDQKRLAEACSSLDELKQCGSLDELKGGEASSRSPRANGLVAFWKAQSYVDEDDADIALTLDEDNGDNGNQGQAVITASQLLELTEEFRRKEAMIKEKDQQISRLVEAVDAYNKEESEIMGEKDRIITFLTREVEQFENERSGGRGMVETTNAGVAAAGAETEDVEDDGEGSLADDPVSRAGLDTTSRDWKDTDDGIDIILALSNSTDNMKMSEDIKVNLMMKLYGLEQKLLEKEMELEEVKLALHARELEMVREKDEEIRELRKKLREQEYSKKTSQESQASSASKTFVTARTRETSDTFMTAQTTFEQEVAEEAIGKINGVKLHID